MIKKYYKGDILYYEGDRLDGFMFLESGSVKAFKYSGENEIFLYSLNNGELITDCGGVALTTVEFLEDSEVQFIEHLDKERLFDELQERLFDELQERLLLLNEAFNIVNFDAVGKVAYYIAKKDFNSFSHKEVAARLNITSETVSRVLNKLKKLNVISVGSDVQILDSSKLHQFFE